MPARASAPAPAANGASLASVLMVSVVIVLVALVSAGFWLQQQRNEAAHLRLQADIYDNYLEDTQPEDTPVQLPRSFLEAQAVREHLLNHPAVTPGAAFNQQGVQSTGKAIVDAIDRAKGL